MHASLHSRIDFSNDFGITAVLAPRTAIFMTMGGTISEVFRSGNCENAAQIWNFVEHVGERVSEPASNDWITSAKSPIVAFLNASHFGTLLEEFFRHGPGFIQV